MSKVIKDDAEQTLSLLEEGLYSYARETDMILRDFGNALAYLHREIETIKTLSQLDVR